MTLLFDYIFLSLLSKWKIYDLSNHFYIENEIQGNLCLLTLIVKEFILMKLQSLGQKAKVVSGTFKALFVLFGLIRV